MQRVDLPYQTTTDAISVFDTDNQYRKRLWTETSSDIDWLREEDNGLLLTLIEDYAPNTGRSMNQPIIHWTEDSRLDVHTTLAASATSTGTELTLVDPRVTIADSLLFFPADGEIVKVSSIVNGTGVATVVRGYNDTAKVAKGAGDIVIAFPSFMAELSTPNLGNGKLPGEYMWNCISIVAETTKTSRLQESSEVADGWGQMDKARFDTMLDLRRKTGKALFFNSRGTTDTGAEGQEYISQGIYHYIQDGLLDLGNDNSSLTWPILNDWLEARFDPDASSTNKALPCGLWLFKAIQRMVRDTRGEAVQPYFEPALGTMVYRISTDGGYSVAVMLDKYGLAVNEGLGDWGFLLDMAHIEGAHYEGLPFQWIENIQDNNDIMVQEDCFIGSFSVMVKHQSCHGVIRGAGQPIVNR